MALRGTLKDFGVAEILQLIAQQTKSGVLRLRDRDEEVHVWFDAGNVVRAEQVAGKEVHLLGHRLVRAGIITERELEDALEEQRRTLERLGDVLLARNAVSREDLQEMTALQATETLYRLLTWKNGTYEFEAGEVEWERDAFRPIRCDAILMEGFRMLDEWPQVRKKITSRHMTFERLRDLPPPVAAQGEGDGEDFAFLEAPAETSGGEQLGPNEWRVMALVQKGRTVERLIELSRLGEFETCKALYNLVSAGYLEAIPPPARDSAAPPGTGMVRSLAERARAFGTRLAFTLALLALFAAMVWRLGAGRDAAVVDVADAAVHRLVAAAQRARIEAALEVHRLEAGAYPERLAELVEVGLLRERDLRHPWSSPWHYRRIGEGSFVLLPPFE